MSIPYTTKSWNPCVQCAGCELGEACWAIGMARRQKYADQVLTADRKHWSGESVVFEERFAEPLRWRKPQVVATCFMGDLAHADAETIRRVFGVALVCDESQFLFLTKWPALLLEKLRIGRTQTGITRVALQQTALQGALDGNPAFTKYLGHLWVGVSVTDQATYNARWSVLCEQWDGPKWISAEPLTSPLEVGGFGMPDWLVAGSAGSLAHGAAAFTQQIAYDLRRQCAEAGVPYWAKQSLRWTCRDCGTWVWEQEADCPACGGKLKPSVEVPWFGDDWGGPIRESPPAIADILQREGKLCRSDSSSDSR